MAKKKRSRRSKSMTLPLAIVAPLGMYVVERGQDLANGVEPSLVGDRVVQHFTGYSIKANNFDWPRLKQGLLPVTVGILVHKMAGRLGINRAIASAGIPYIRV